MTIGGTAVRGARKLNVVSPYLKRSYYDAHTVFKCIGTNCCLPYFSLKNMTYFVFVVCMNDILKLKFQLSMIFIEQFCYTKSYILIKIKLFPLNLNMF